MRWVASTVNFVDTYCGSSRDLFGDVQKWWYEVTWGQTVAVSTDHAVAGRWLIGTVAVSAENLHCTFRINAWSQLNVRAPALLLNQRIGWSKPASFRTHGRKAAPAAGTFWRSRPMISRYKPAMLRRQHDPVHREAQ